MWNYFAKRRGANSLTHVWKLSSLACFHHLSGSVILHDSVYALPRSSFKMTSGTFWHENDMVLQIYAMLSRSQSSALAPVWFTSRKLHCRLNTSIYSLTPIRLLQNGGSVETVLVHETPGNKVLRAVLFHFALLCYSHCRLCVSLMVKSSWPYVWRWICNFSIPECILWVNTVFLGRVATNRSAALRIAHSFINWSESHEGNCSFLVSIRTTHATA